MGFGFTAANAAMLDAVEGNPVIHIVDFSSTHCMTLIEAMATRLQGPLLVKLTVAGLTEEVPPMLDIFSYYDEVGFKLVNFARSRNISLEFKVVPCSSSDGFRHFIEHLTSQQQKQQQKQLKPQYGGEALVINCQMALHMIPEETLSSPSSSSSSSFYHYSPEYRSPRTRFVEGIRGLSPTIVILVDEDADFTSAEISAKLHVDTVRHGGHLSGKQRQLYDAGMCWKIENVVAEEGWRGRRRGGGGRIG
ncbi:hypothetical protein Dimus_030642 [Dionaea muscipula]